MLTDKPMLNKCVTMNLDRCSDDGKYWKSPPLFIHAEEGDTFHYRYVIKYKEGFRAWLWKKVTFSRNKDEKTIKETKSRGLNRGSNQFDIFHHPSDPNWRGSVFTGQLFFVKSLCQELGNGGDFKELLMESEHIGFGHPTYTMEEVKCFLEWVAEMVNGNPTSCQSVYICSLLGQFVNRVPSWSAWYTCRTLGRKAADSILQSLSRSTYMALPQTSIKFIKLIAQDLFKAGSSTGCLIFIKCFCNMLDVNYVLQVAGKLQPSYTEQIFDQQVPGTLDSLKRLNNSNSCSRYSSYVIQCAPSVPCLWNLYQIVSFHFPSLVGSLSEEFVRVYCKFISSSRARKPSLLDPVFWCQMPGNLKEKLANPFCKALTDQIPSETCWSKEKLASLKSIVLDASLQSSNHFHQLVLCAVVRHTSKEVVSMLPDILNLDRFCCHWNTSVPEEEKEKNLPSVVNKSLRN